MLFCITGRVLIIKASDVEQLCHTAGTNSTGSNRWRPSDSRRQFDQDMPQRSDD